MGDRRMSMRPFDRSSEEYRHLCEVRHVRRMSEEARQHYFALVRARSPKRYQRLLDDVLDGNESQDEREG